MITSTANSQIKALIQLMTKAKVRRDKSLFVTEGIKMVLETPSDRLEKIYVSEKFITNPSNLKKLDGFLYEVVSDEVFKHVSDTVTPQGVLALVKMKEHNLDEMFVKKEGNLFVILEDVQDLGNLGTIIRTAEGAGVRGIIMTKNTVDIYNPKVIRSTMGAIYRMPFMYTDNIESVISQMQQKKTVICAAHLNGKNNYFDEDYTGNTAFIIGNESKGITDELAGKADVLVKIPMEGKVESLNASVAASILMYEAYRQKCKHSSH